MLTTLQWPGQPYSKEPPCSEWWQWVASSLGQSAPEARHRPGLCVVDNHVQLSGCSFLTLDKQHGGPPGK